MKKKIAITIDMEIWGKAKILADEENRTLSNLINKILSDYLEEKAKM